MDLHANEHPFPECLRIVYLIRLFYLYRRTVVLQFIRWITTELRLTFEGVIFLKKFKDPAMSNYSAIFK